MKNYIKPAISFQGLIMTANAAGGCAHKANSGEAACPVELPGLPGFTVFVEGACVLTTPEDAAQICYHVPQADVNVFES